MPGVTDTTMPPEVAPVGIVTVIDVALQEFTVTNAPLNRTTPLDPKFVPVITTWLPIGPVVAERLAIAGAGLAEGLTETLSNVAV
jgi:hypothetical protein